MTRAADPAAESTDFSARVMGLAIFDAYQLHKSVGAALFAAVLVRLVVGSATRCPTQSLNDGPAIHLAARVVQATLYLLIPELPHGAL